MGNAVYPDQAHEAIRRPALLSPGRRRSAAGIRRLLYGEGYTIRGVQRILKEHGIKSVQGLVDGAAAPAFAPAAGTKRQVAAEDHDEDIADVEAEDEVDDEDDIEEEVAPPVVARREPPMQRREPEIQRREPDIAPPQRVEPSLRAPVGVTAQPPARPAPAVPAAPVPRDTTELKAVLDDLIACRQLLDAALKDG